MRQYEDIAPTVRHIEKLAQKLIQAITVLNTRLDAQVTASTDADADYAAEVADAREEQYRILTDESLQRQLNTLSEAVLEVLAIISENRERQTGGRE